MTTQRQRGKGCLQDQLGFSEAVQFLCLDFQFIWYMILPQRGDNAFFEPKDHQLHQTSWKIDFLMKVNLTPHSMLSLLPFLKGKVYANVMRRHGACTWWSRGFMSSISHQFLFNSPPQHSSAPPLAILDPKHCAPLWPWLECYELFLVFICW